MAETTAPQPPAIACEKCKTGTMAATRVPRFSQALRIIGFTLWIPAIIILLVSTIIVFAGLGSAGTSATEMVTTARNQGANRLGDVRMMPDAVVDDFRKDGKVEETVIVTLSTAQQEAVRREMSSYNATLAGSALGSGAVAGIGGGCLVGVYFILVPVMVLGFVLTLKKNVWRCGTCSFIYDRA